MWSNTSFTPTSKHIPYTLHARYVLDQETQNVHSLNEATTSSCYQTLILSEDGSCLYCQAVQHWHFLVETTKQLHLNIVNWSRWRVVVATHIVLQVSLRALRCISILLRSLMLFVRYDQVQQDVKSMLSNTAACCWKLLHKRQLNQLMEQQLGTAELK